MTDYTSDRTQRNRGNVSSKPELKSVTDALEFAHTLVSADHRQRHR
jgi:hypothetical protein